MFCRSLVEGLLAAWREASPWQTPCVLDFYCFFLRRWRRRTYTPAQTLLGSLKWIFTAQQTSFCLFHFDIAWRPESTHSQFTTRWTTWSCNGTLHIFNLSCVRICWAFFCLWLMIALCHFPINASLCLHSFYWTQRPPGWCLLSERVEIVRWRCWDLSCRPAISAKQR